MADIFTFLIEHGEWVLFTVVFLEQAGLPLPSILFLIAGGAMVGGGLLNGPLVIVLTFAATLAADFIWFEMGRRQGSRILGLLCKISLAPDDCKRHTEQVFARHGLASLLVGKFIPGLSTIAPPLAGLTGVGRFRFLLYDGAGALIWIGSSVGLGALFSDQLERLTDYLAQWAAAMGGLVAAILASYVGYKFLMRTLIIRRLRMARISADELRRMMAAGDEPLVVDLRNPLDVSSNPYVIPGALRMSPDQIEQRHGEISRGRDVILYCS